MIRTSKIRFLVVGLYLAAVLLWAVAAPVLAQDSTTPGREVTADEVNQVARELWCPLCSGVRLDSCELKACDQMKEVIAIKLAEGEDTESIKQYFVGQYGPQVLGEPPREGFNWLAWILPVVALVIGAVFLWRQMGRMIGPAAPADATAEAGPVSGSTPASQGKPPQEDEYERKLNEELTKYG